MVENARGRTIQFKSLPTDLSVVTEWCDQVQYPFTHKLFQIIMTYSVTVDTAEQSFSTL